MPWEKLNLCCDENLCPQPQVLLKYVSLLQHYIDMNITGKAGRKETHMMCNVVGPSGRKRNTHQAFPILLHPVIRMNPNTTLALRINCSNYLVSTGWTLQECSMEPKKEEFHIKIHYPAHVRVMSNREISSRIALVDFICMSDVMSTCSAMNVSPVTWWQGTTVLRYSKKSDWDYPTSCQR